MRNGLVKSLMTRLVETDFSDFDFWDLLDLRVVSSKKLHRHGQNLHCSAITNIGWRKEKGFFFNDTIYPGSILNVWQINVSFTSGYLVLLLSNFLQLVFWFHLSFHGFWLLTWSLSNYWNIQRLPGGLHRAIRPTQIIRY